MRRFTKVLALVLAFVLMATAFTGCKSSSDDFKVGVIHIGDPSEGSGYSYAHDVGIQQMETKLELKKGQVIRKLNVDDGNPTEIETAIRECIEEGAKIIFGTSWGYMDTMETLAKEYPDIIFSHCSGYKSNDKNFNNYFGKIYEARYLAGIAAGLKTKSGLIGYVAAQDSQNPEVTGGINAFALGVQSVNPTAKVYVKVTNTWFDPDLEKASAIALLDLGCDVIAQHQDTAQPQVAAEERGVWGCGYNSDMTSQAPKAHLTAPIWNWGVYYTEATKAAMDGTWKPVNYFDGMAEGLVDISPLSENCATGTKEAVAAAKSNIVSGDLKVFAGEIKDNTGAVRVAAGESLDDAYIAGQMNWYVAGVEVK